MKVNQIYIPLLIVVEAIVEGPEVDVRGQNKNFFQFKLPALPVDVAAAVVVDVAFVCPAIIMNFIFFPDLINFIDKKVLHTQYKTKGNTNNCAHNKKQ